MDEACAVCYTVYSMLHIWLALNLHCVICRFLWGGGGPDRPVRGVAQGILPGLLLWAFCQVTAGGYCS